MINERVGFKKKGKKKERKTVKGGTFEIAYNGSLSKVVWTFSRFFVGPL